MTVYDLISKLNGEIVRGRARVRTPEGYVIVGRLNGDEMTFTEDGRKLAAEQKPKASRRTKPADVAGLIDTAKAED